MYFKDHQEIQPNSEAIVWAKLSSGCGTNQLRMIEADRQDQRQNYIVGRTLVSSTPDEPVPIRVINPTRYPAHVKRGEVIGKCQPVDVVINCEMNPPENNDVPQSKATMEGLIRDTCKELSAQESAKAKAFLQKHWQRFAVDSQHRGRTSIVKHRIDTGGSIPIRQVPRRVPLAKREEVAKLLTEMEANKVIESSSSPWSSPVVLVKKKDGTTRFCVDYRKLNDVTKKDSYPLPRIDDTLDMLSGAKWFSTLDLQSGYWQVEMEEHDKEKTAFSAGGGLWQFLVMPFGLCNAPATFERLMECVLKGLHWKTCLVYLDDIIIMGKDFEEHIRNLEDVFQRLSAAGLKLNAKKCSLFKKEVKYLGHKVSTEGVQTDEDKIRMVKEWPRPTNVSELRSFLGLCTYYRRFVPGFADVASALHELTRKNQPFKWTEKQERAFQQLKHLLCTAPVLRYPVPGEQFILDTDASAQGIGAVLSQRVDGQEKVVGYFSKILSKPERNYCVTRKELLAILEGIKHYHKYLYGQPFLLRTDHAALKWLLQFKDPEGQLARWIERLQSYDFRIEHRKGSSHGNADALSRRPCESGCRHCCRAEGKEGLVDVRMCNVLPEEDWTKENIIKEQRNDNDLRDIIECLEKGKRPAWHDISSKSATFKAYWAQWRSLRVMDKCLYRIWETEDGRCSTPLLVVPESKIKEVIEAYHNEPGGGHLGVTKTTEKIKRRFYWIGCRETVTEWIQRCEQCMLAKGPRQKTHGRMQQYNVGAPFERIAMDIVGPFPESDSGNKYALVVIDYFSKWPEVYALPNQEAETVADVFIKNWICRYGAPLELHSDQGRNFESNVFREVCRMMGVHKTRTTALHPQSDGMVERFNKTLEEHLRKVVHESQRDWDQRIPMFLMAYRSSVHDTTQVSPAKAIFGADLKLPADLRFGTLLPERSTIGNYVARQREEMGKVHTLMRERTQLKSDKMKARYDLRSNSDGFEDGQLVLLHNPQRKRGLCPKLQTHWEGPYRIVKRINDVVYRIQRRPRSKFKVVHLDRLAPYTADYEDLVRDEQV